MSRSASLDSVDNERDAVGASILRAALELNRVGRTVEARLEIADAKQVVSRSAEGSWNELLESVISALHDDAVQS